MATFHYIGLDQAGHPSNGTVEAVSKEAAIAVLLASGIQPIEADIVSPAASGFSKRTRSQPKLKLASLAEFAREVGTLASARVVLDDALRVTSLDAQRKDTRALAAACREGVRQGESLSKTLAGSAFEIPAYVVGTIRASEEGGTLGKTLLEIAEHFEQKLVVSERLKSALIYPAILLGLAGISIVIILGILLPALVPLITAGGSAPPLSVQILLHSRDIIVGNWLYLALATLGIGGIVSGIMKRPTVAIGLDRLKLRLPLIGDTLRRAESANFARVLSSVLSSGVPIVPGLDLTRTAIQNRAIAKALDDAIEEIKNGKSITASLNMPGLLSPRAVSMINVGERSGQLPEMLGQVARMLDKETTQRVERLMAILTPVMTIIIGLAVGGLILTVMDAILSVNEMALK